MTGAEIRKFCPRCDATGFAPKAAHHLVWPVCSFQWFIDPVAGAACFILDDHNQVLLIRRQKDPGDGRLATPGGFIDLGETAEAGIIREVREETGLHLLAVKFLCSQPNTYAYGDYTYPVLDLFFTTRVPSFSGQRQGEDVADILTPLAREVRAEDLAFPSMQLAWTQLAGRIR